MSTPTTQPRPPLSTIDKTILTVHGLVAGIVGIIGFLGATDPGWRDLQRLVIVMMVGLWIVGIVAMGLIARLVTNQWARVAILLAGPFIGIALIVGSSMLG